MVRRQLEPLVSGVEILGGWSHPSEKFASAPEAAGHRISGVSRRGKYLLFGLEGVANHLGTERELVVHLGMTGSSTSTRRRPTTPMSGPGGCWATAGTSGSATCDGSAGSRSCAAVTTGPFPPSGTWDPSRSTGR